MSCRQAWRALISLTCLLVASPCVASEPDSVKALAESAGFGVPFKLYRKPAPDFELRTADGTRLSLGKDLKGRPVVLYIFTPG